MEEQMEPPTELEKLVSELQRLRADLETSKEEQERIAAQIAVLKQRLADSKAGGGDPPPPAS